MPKKLDNSLSYSPDELINNINNTITEIGFNLELEKYVKLIKEYLNDNKLFDEWENYFGQEIHLSIPSKVKDNCKVCNETSNQEEDEQCRDYYSSANDFYYVRLILFVNFIENNKHLFNSGQTLFSLTNEFLNNFKFKEGELTFNAKRFDNILITHVILTLRDTFKKMESQTAIIEINNTIEELETHKLVAKTTGRVLYDMVNPQLKFLKKQIKYYQNINIHPGKPQDDELDISNYKGLKNVFRESMPLKTVIQHFQIFTTKNSKNGNPFLTEEQFEIFIKRAFCGKTHLPLQQFNHVARGEKLLIQYLFRQFYDQYCCQFYNTAQVQDHFIKLLTDNFIGWDFKNVKDNFNKKPKTTIQLL